MYLITGLGNPGQAYVSSRHNAGYQVIDLWSSGLGISLKTSRFQGKLVSILYQKKKLLFLCPETFMNHSGKSIRACADYYGIDSHHILVIHDDLDLCVGQVKVVRKGRAAGHKGVASIINHLGTTQFPRIKIGIGRPRYGEMIEDFVLKPFYPDQLEQMKTVYQRAVHACELFVTKSIEYAMNQINCKTKTNTEEII